MRDVLAFALCLSCVSTTSAATFTVTNLDESGPGSLRDAIGQANASADVDSISFGVSGTIVLTSGPIRITGPVSIAGPGAAKLTIDGNASSRIFLIQQADAPSCPALSSPADFLVSLSGLTLANAANTADSAGSGGAIRSAHSLAVDSMVFRGNVAKAGGGISFVMQYAGQSLTINKSEFTNNLAKPVDPTTTSGIYGGAVLVTERCNNTRTAGVVSITGSVFSGNRAQPTTQFSYGGAIGLYAYGADITIAESRIVDNRVDVPSPRVPGWFYNGGGVYGPAKSLNILRSEIADGTADAAGGVGGYNDAPESQGDESAMVLKIINSTLSGNGAGVAGGAVYVYGNVAVSAENSTIAGNLGGTGGAIHLNTGPTFPVSAGKARAPQLALSSSILANPASNWDIGINTSVMPSYVVSSNSSLIQKECGSCNITIVGAANKIGVDPNLSSLAFNGGPTRTQALLAGSPAIDAGANSLGLSTDQRGTGFARVTNGVADMGAYEFGSSPPALPDNYEGLWWNSPAESESGWGINLAHQGDVIFATWFTYDQAGKPWWLSMTAAKTGDKTYDGTLYETTGPAFNAVPFAPSAVTPKAVGSGSLTFGGANEGTFAYLVNGVQQSKAITRQVFGRLPTCVFGAQDNLALATNYQDLWWNAPAGSEAGWGVNFTHQGDTIFATWFTYVADGKPLWLSATTTKTAPGKYVGTLYRTSGPAFNAVPFDPKKVTPTSVGTLTLSFANGNSASFAYTVNDVNQTKQITRQVFRVPGTVCQ